MHTSPNLCRTRCTYNFILARGHWSIVVRPTCCVRCYETGKQRTSIGLSGQKGLHLSPPPKKVVQLNCVKTELLVVLTSSSLSTSSLTSVLLSLLMSLSTSSPGFNDSFRRLNVNYECFLVHEGCAEPR